jgi:hypothetical protein
MPLFAQSLCVDDPIAADPLPGRFDDALGLRLDDAGDPIAARLAMPTRADRDRPGDAELMPTGTKAMSDRDEAPCAAYDPYLGTRTAGGADRDDDRLLLTTITFSGPDRDD